MAKGTETWKTVPFVILQWANNKVIKQRLP